MLLYRIGYVYGVWLMNISRSFVSGHFPEEKIEAEVIGCGESVM